MRGTDFVAISPKPFASSPRRGISHPIAELSNVIIFSYTKTSWHIGPQHSGRCTRCAICRTHYRLVFRDISIRNKIKKSEQKFQIKNISSNISKNILQQTRIILNSISRKIRLAYRVQGETSVSHKESRRRPKCGLSCIKLRQLDGRSRGRARPAR